MTPERAALSFLNQWNGTTREHATALQRQGMVQQIFGNRQLTQGRVEIEGGSYHCTLRFINESWQGECDPRDHHAPTALAAVMLERLERGAELPEAPTEVGSDDVHSVLTRRLQRNLDDEEEEFLTKLIKRYQRYTASREIYSTDLVRLQPRWPIDSYEPLQLWPQPPANVVEFWNYLAYNFDKRGLRWPEFLNAVTDLDQVRRRLEAWEQDRLQGLWRKRFQKFGRRDARPECVPLELRLLVTFSELRLQWRRRRDDDDGCADIGGRGFQTLENDGLASFIEDLEHGRTRLDPDSAALWFRFIEQWRRSGQVRLRLEDRQHGQWLADLWQDGALEPRLRSLDEAAFRREPTALCWQCSASGNGHSYRLRLMHGNHGPPLPHSVRALPGSHRTFYLADDCLFEGPPWWDDDTEVLPEYEVPAGLIESDQGLEFLQSIEAGIDDELAARVEEIPVRLRLQANLTDPSAPGAREHLLLRVVGADPSGRHVEQLGPDGWTVTRQIPPEPGCLRRFDRSRLRGVYALLEPLQLSYDQSQQLFRARITKAFPERFHQWLQSLPADVPLELDAALESLRSGPLKARLDVQLSGSPDADWFDLQLALDVDLDEYQLSRQELKELIAARGGFVRASDGRWHRLELDLSEDQARSVEHLGIDAFDPGGSRQRLHAAQLADAATRHLFSGSQRDLALEAARRISLEVRPAVPTGLNVSLRPYQIQGFQFLAYLSENRFGGILADDMGLGKTVQTITWLLWLKRAREPGCGRGLNLVVCPKSVVDVWLSEVPKATPDLRIRALEDTAGPPPDLADTDILCINYAQLRGCADWLQPVPWQAVVLDEGQHIKNPDSLAARTARSLQAEHRVVLTGTPIENRLLDIWSLMEFAMPEVLGARGVFRKRFDRRRDPQAHVRLAARLRPFLLRRTKRQVAPELPARSEEVLLTDLTETQRALYDRELDHIRGVLLKSADDRSLNENRFAILQGLTRLRQICCHPGLLDGGDTADIEASAKLENLLELIDQLRAEGHKVLVFSQFVRMLEVVRSVLQKRRIPFSMLTGKTTDRGRLVEEFQASDDARVFLLSLKAGGSGLNLTAASYVVLFDPWWNPAVENQAIDRTHRIGQRNPVTAYRLISRGTVEAKIRAMQEYKAALAGDILSDEAFGRSLTRDDLRYLLDLGPAGAAAHAGGILGDEDDAGHPLAPAR